MKITGSAPSKSRMTGVSRLLAIGSAGALLAMLAACGDGKTKAPGQVVARVNGTEITVHQLNGELARRGVQGAGKNEHASQQTLEALVDQQLLVEQATAAKLDRDPQVLQALENSRRQILSQAYLERNTTLTRPTADEIGSFYDANPALFRQRRVYTFRDYVIDRAQLTDAFRAKLDDPRVRDDLAGQLKAAKIAFREASGMRGAEQLSLEMLPGIAAMKKGEVFVVLNGDTAVLMQFLDSSEHPIALDKASPYIEQYLTNARRKQAVESRIKELRSSAKIAYVGASAPGHGETSARAKPGTAAAEPPAPAAPGTGVAESSIRKGLQSLTGK